MLLLPYGLDDARVTRLPIVSFAIVGLCSAAFAFTWLIPDDPREAVMHLANDAMSYYLEHPYLEMPERIGSRVKLPPGQLEALQRTRRMPDSARRAAEQAVLEEKVAAIFSALDDHPLKRFSLVP